MQNIVQLQSQLQGIDDNTLSRALSQPNNAAPQFLLMMESNRRRQMRDGSPTGPAPMGNMRAEMSTGTYQPAPRPPVRMPPPAEAAMSTGIMTGMGQSPTQAPQPSAPQASMQANPSTPSGIGSLFSARR